MIRKLRRINLKEVRDLKRKRVALILVIVFSLFGRSSIANASLTYSYYGTGSYVSSAPVTPTSGLGFYVDYSAITVFNSGPFASAFDWNGDYRASVTAVAQYPVSATAYPNYFVISGVTTLQDDVFGDTLYYNSSGSLLNVSMEEPMDSSSIYRCRIALNAADDVFDEEEQLEKTIIHEVGHVLLLKHPTSPYVHSVMHQGNPNGSLISATVTTSDRNNIVAKWGR